MKISYNEKSKKSNVKHVNSVCGQVTDSFDLLWHIALSHPQYLTQIKRMGLEGVTI